MSRQATSTPQPIDRILRPREVSLRLGVSQPTLWRLRQRGELPHPLQISRGAVGWRESVIEAWLNERAAKVAA
jgi:prophage regulatory protein